MARLTKKFLAALSAFVLLAACGKPAGSFQKNWPAHIQSMSGFSREEQEAIVNSIETLNEKAGKTLISFKANNGYPIQLIRVPTQSENPQYGGLATPSSDHCLVQFTETLFKKDNLSFIPSVVWHELGHCKGMSHDKKDHEVMSVVTSRFSTFSEETLQKFLDEFSETK